MRRGPTPSLWPAWDELWAQVGAAATGPVSVNGPRASNPALRKCFSRCDLLHLNAHYTSRQ